MPSGTAPLCLFAGEALARYHFGADHAFGPARYPAFMESLRSHGLAERVRLCAPVEAGEADLTLFHSAGYLALVRERCAAGRGYLDYGDTPARRGLYEAAATVVGTTLAAVDAVMSGPCRHAFVPIAGLHHARRDRAAGFCVFNDCAVAIEHLRQRHGLQRIAYVDIDAHHGDGVYYGFESDPGLALVDFHEDGRTLYPGSGRADETGKGAAKGTKLNIPLPPGAGDKAFLEAWPRVVAHLRKFEPQFVVFQCGADGLDGDPLAHLTYTPQVHAHAARSLVHLAGQYCGGRLMAFGGGGYSRHNLARAWSEVLHELAALPPA